MITQMIIISKVQDINKELSKNTQILVVLMKLISTMFRKLGMNMKEGNVCFIQFLLALG